jgi:hypothetical protein
MFFHADMGLKMEKCGVGSSSLLHPGPKSWLPSSGEMGEADLVRRAHETNGSWLNSAEMGEANGSWL